MTLAVILVAVDSEPKERNGWHFAGLPLINFNSDEGVGYGVRLAAYDHGQNEKPYHYALIGQFFQTTRGVAFHSVQFDAPRFRGSAWRLGLQGQLNAERFSNYFGLGNRSERIAELTECDDSAALEENPDVCPGNPAFIGARYYQYSERVPTAVLNLRRDLSEDWQLFIGYRFRFYDLDVTYDRDDLGQSAPSKLLEDLEAGESIVGLELDENGDARGQREADIRLGIFYDTRDNEPSPNSGMFNTLTARIAGPAVGGAFTYGGVNLHLRAYQLLTPRLVLAGRLLADFTFGDVPFYQLTVIPALSDVDGLGGSTTLRGILKNRYSGKIKLSSSVEARYRLTQFSLFGQDIAMTLMAGFDAGRVWADYESD
ncbi:MAG: BamA/TamA family outer membrane protein [Myxococcota bacterium]